MSKKIDASLKRLIRALAKHAKTAGDRAVSRKKLERALVNVHAAASEYAAAVEKKTGFGSSFPVIVLPALDADTLSSLEAERKVLAERSTGPIPQQVATQ